MLDKKYTLITCLGLIALTNAVKPPGYVEPNKPLDKVNIALLLMNFLNLSLNSIFSKYV